MRPMAASGTGAPGLPFNPLCPWLGLNDGDRQALSRVLARRGQRIPFTPGRGPVAGSRSLPVAIEYKNDEWACGQERWGFGREGAY